MEHIPVVINNEKMKYLKDKVLSLNFRKTDVLDRFGVKNYSSWEKENEEMPAKIFKYLANPAHDDLDIIIRLLVFNQDIEKQTAERILSSNAISTLLESGILKITNDDNHYVSGFSMFEFNGLLLITDSIINELPNINPVMPLLPESYELGELQLKREVKKTLDLGTGSGVQALIASRHSENVIGVDINPRSIAFSKFNAALNDIKNTEFYESNLFSAVKGQKFDLILANPPYMPDKNHKPGDNFFCGGEMGDVIWSKIISEMDNYLGDNGICQIIHMLISIHKGTFEQKVVSLLGQNSNKYSTIVLSKPIDFRIESIKIHYSTKFALTNFKKHEDPYQFIYSELPFPRDFLKNDFIDKL